MYELDTLRHKARHGLEHLSLEIRSSCANKSQTTTTEQCQVAAGSICDGPAETLSKAKNTSVAGLSQAGILLARGGKVRLLRRDELPEDWDPVTDTRRTVWEVTQHLIHALEKKGEEGAAALLRRAGEQGEVARDLAYRLYSTCERKKWASEALAYNSLVIAWPQIARLALSALEVPDRRGELFG